MASQYIKIFNDTVLKQSILQGYESQRQNPNLGKFTSGELAFTRDTGRVFVGNYSDDPKENDLETVDGGILLGNKYLGIIDSRPIAYVQDTTTGTTGLAGLSYEENNNLEEALFKTNTRVKKNGKINDWDNDPSFNPTYGTYNGDYLYDVWRNALIIFDNNIKPNSNELKIIEPFTKNEKVYDKLDNDITESARIRTPLDDLTNNETMKDYPIYGNGYVIFRMIEPDGKTIKYQQRNITSVDSKTEENVGNWTHNILEVDFSVDNLKHIFDYDKFTINKNGLISFNNIILDSNSTVKLPNYINFTNTSNDTISYDFVTQLSKELPTENEGTDYFLGYNFENINNVPTITLKQITKDQMNSFVEKQDLNITIETSGNLKVNDGYSATSTFFKLSIEEEEKEDEISTGFYDPWSCYAEEYYFGTGKYEVGKLVETNDYSVVFTDSVTQIDATHPTKTDNEGNPLQLEQYIENKAEDKEKKFEETLSQFIAYSKFNIKDVNGQDDDFVDITNERIERDVNGNIIERDENETEIKRDENGELKDRGNQSLVQTDEQTPKLYWNCNVGLNYLKIPFGDAPFISNSSATSKTIKCDSISDITVNSPTSNDERYNKLRLIPDHAESIIVLIETKSSSTAGESLSSPAEVYVTGKDYYENDYKLPIFKSYQSDFTTTVEIPLIPTIQSESFKHEETSGQNESETTTYSVIKDKKFSFTVKNCSAKLLGYRL